MALAACALLAASPALLAQTPEPPPFYAITDVEVVTGTGEVLQGATVLIADGLIEAVGQGLEVPGDARVYEGAGLKLYPGMVDALTQIGVKSDNGGNQQSSGGGGNPFQPSGPQIRGPEDRPRTTPWKSPADDLDAAAAAIESWREAGFTSAVVAPGDGFFPGQAAWINLGGGEADALVVATPIAQRIEFPTGGFGTYPGSLMGVLSYVRQVLEDADHHADALAIYERSPAGRQRPEYDRTLEPLIAAREAALPFLLPAVTGPQIDRALALGRRYELRTVLVGAHQAYRRLDRIAASGAPVIVSLEWPEEPKDRAPDAEDAFRDLAHRRLAPSTPRRLAEAGIPFAFTSGGLKNSGDVWKGVRAAIAAGLSEQAALAALTTTPAELFGVADRVGTIEKGKIANLVLATAAPWAEDAEIHHVFVDGHPYGDGAEEEEEDAEPPSVDVSGTWTLTMTTPGGEVEMTAELEQGEDGKVTGEIRSERGETTLKDGRVAANVLTFEVSQETPRGTMDASYRAEVEGESLEGTLSAGPMSFEVAGARTSAAPAGGAGDGESGDEAEVEVADSELEELWRLYQGPVDEGDDFAIVGATVHTVSGETIENGTVVVQGGEIRAVGRGARVPGGLRTIDGAGLHLIPGIIDAHSHIAVEGSVNEGSLNVTSMVGIEDVVDPDDISIYRALAGGVTAINILHGSANPIGGKNAVIKLRWGQDADGLFFAGAPPGIKFALGENPKRSRGGFGPGRYPATRMGVIDVIRQAFVDAKAYQKEWRDYEAARAAGREPIPPRRDFELEPLVEILEGERLVHAHCYRADEILQLIRLADEMGFQIATLQHVLEGYKVADEIAAHGAGASTFSDWWGYKVEAYDAIPHNAALMTERGVLVSINSDSGEEMRHLNHEAAKTIRWGGLSEREALALVTLNPARQLRIDDRVGSIEVGKDADLVLYRGHPLDASSVVLKTFVDGRLYFDLEADRERQQAIDAMKDRLVGRGEDETGDGEQTPDATPDATPDPDATDSAEPRQGAAR
ncbi:MAG: hypothetical protein DWQ30_00260 [Acidobacteria bacterium]|nr:MAG: hypothetical protein DWQ30_00260 [Acidobacteriota bacterium]